MSSHSVLQREEEALGPWPRRLLHVPTLTSYEWQPGNVYGGVTEPEFNAITYTWGRWRLKDHELPNVPPITIHGASWTIPRVRPSHFTAAHLEHVLRRACQGVSKVGYWQEATLPSVDFIWLDIACIDQRENEPRSAAEVGRQAMIFDKAKHVVAWLGTIPISTLNPLLSDLSHLTTAIGDLVRSKDDLQSASAQHILDQTYTQLAKLTRDPWFSSLWTLQEVYLRSDTVLMSNDGVIATAPREPTAPVPKSGVPLQADVWTLLEFYENALMTGEEPMAAPGTYDKIVELMRSTGLAALATTSALAAYTATDHRTCIKDEDRVYGIQQIFGARVGTSALNNPLGASYSRVQLEIQLGEHLLRHMPVLSQLHIFTEPPPFGMAWLISRKSSVPTDLMGVVVTRGGTRTDINEETSLCELSVAKVDQDTWGQFKGLYCSFTTLHQQCSELLQSSLLGETFSRDNYLTVHLDTVPELAASPEYLSSGFVPVPRGQRQERLATWLMQSFPEDELGVLLLGSRAATHLEAMIGLLVLRRSTPQLTYHHRIGICWWHLSYATVGGDYLPGGEFLSGIGSPWQEKTCCFG